MPDPGAASSPRFSHLDDVEYQEVRRIGQGDRTMSVWEKWLDFSPAYLSLYAKWDPGMIVQPHGHNSNHVVFVLEGEMTCGTVAGDRTSHSTRATHSVPSSPVRRARSPSR